MFLVFFRNILCPQQMFPSLRSMETQHSFYEQQCVRNNVSTFASTFKIPWFSGFVFGLTAIFPFSFQVETVEMANLVREVAI